VLVPLALAAVALASPSFSGERAHATVRALTTIGPRVAGSEGERRAADLVAKRLRSLGYRVVVQTFPLPEGTLSRNVVGLPDGPIRAVVVAHMDTVHGSPGANDNGSGVAVMLELARVLRGTDGVLFAALGAEERAATNSRSHLGSIRLARGFSAAGKRRIRLAFSLDMVGVGPRLHVRGIEARPNRSARRLLAAGGGATYLRDPGHSDHEELTRAGLPAAWVQWRQDACWHRSCDRADRVSRAKLAAAGRMALRALTKALESL
jgi:hypothetical protein